VQNAHGLFNIVFFVVLFSVLLQGTTTAWLAKRLNVAQPAEDNMIERQVVSNKLEVTISAASPAVGKHVVELGLPPSSLIVLLTRGQASLIPRGNTKIEAGDVMLISSPPGDEQQLRLLLLGPTV
jgi:cell volume regulation protein A